MWWDSTSRQSRSMRAFGRREGAVQGAPPETANSSMPTQQRSEALGYYVAD